MSAWFTEFVTEVSGYRTVAIVSCLVTWADFVWEKLNCVEGQLDWSVTQSTNLNRISSYGKCKR